MNVSFFNFTIIKLPCVFLLFTEIKSTLYIVKGNENFHHKQSFNQLNIAVIIDC